MRFCLTIAGVLYAGFFLPVPAIGESLLQATTDEGLFTGKLVARDAQVCWLMGRDGRLGRLDIDRIKKIEAVAPKFRQHTIAELRDIVRREYGKQFEVVASGKYVICAVPQQARRYAAIFDGMYRSVHLYFSRRGFQLEEPEFPMVAVIFPNRTGFAEQCQRDGIRGGGGLLGYYHPDSNRVALFDSGEMHAEPEAQSLRNSSTETPPSLDTIFTRPEIGGTDFKIDVMPQRALGRPAAGEIAADLQATIVHEATHQVAFNIGLHSRIGHNPKWVVEGLATAFEVESMYAGAASDSQHERLNRDRFVWFMNFAETRRKANSIGEFAATDRMFASASPDAYAQSWALTFFLLETRPSKYARFLREIAAREPLRDYPPDERLTDFCTAFGANLEQLDAEFLRFFKRLK